MNKPAESSLPLPSQVPKPHRESAGHIAVISIHGVANQPVAESARAAADLLGMADSTWDTFREDKIRLMVRDPEPSDAIPLDVASRYMHTQLLSENEETLRDLKLSTPGVASGETDDDEVPPVYEATRLSSCRRNPVGEVQTRVEVFEMYWADLSRVKSGVVKAIAGLYQLLFFLAGAGWRSCDHAEAANEHPKGTAWKIFRHSHRMAGQILARFVPTLNFLMMSFAAALLARHIESDTAKFILRLIATLGCAGLTGAVCVWWWNKSNTSHSWRAALIVVATATAVWLAMDFVGGQPAHLGLAAVLTAMALAANVSVFWKLRHRVPRIGQIAAGCGTVLLAVFLVRLLNSHEKDSHGQILEAVFRTGGVCYSLLKLAWISMVILHTVSVIAGGVAHLNAFLATRRGEQTAAQLDRLKRTVVTAHITLLLPALIVGILNVALWQAMIGIAARTALPELRGNQSTALARTLGTLVGAHGTVDFQKAQKSEVDLNWFTCPFDPMHDTKQSLTQLGIVKNGQTKVDAGVFLEQLLADVSITVMSGILFLAATVGLSVWGLLPTILAEVRQKEPNTAGSGASKSVWMGGELVRGYKALRAAGWFIRSWGLIAGGFAMWGIYHLATGSVSSDPPGLRAVRRFADWVPKETLDARANEREKERNNQREEAQKKNAALIAFHQQNGIIAWTEPVLNEEPAKLPDQTEKALIIYRFASDALAWAGLILVLLLTGSGPFSFLALGFRSVLDVGLDVVNWLRVHPRGGNLRTLATARYAAILRHICEARDEENPARYKFARIVILAHSQGTVITADLFRFLGFDGLKNHGLGPVLTGALPVALFTMGSPLRQVYSLRFPHLYAWARHEEDDPPGHDPQPSILPPGAIWANAYRSGDYVGRHLWQTDNDGAWIPGPKDTCSPQCFEYCIGQGAHTHYWDETAPEIGFALNNLVLGRSPW